MRNRFSLVPALVLATVLAACGDTVHRPVPPGAREPRLSAPAVAPSPATRPPESLESLRSAGRAPLELTATAVEGFPPLPTYRATVRNLSDRPVRRVEATVVYFDAAGRKMPGEEHDVAFGSPLKAIEPGGSLESSFLSRVDRAPGVRLVLRSVTFLEKGAGGEAVAREWTNPRHAEEVAGAGGR